ncbi:MAG: NosD domain-containing protein, partial [Candidatus Hermodarchaeota archaeon]
MKISKIFKKSDNKIRIIILLAFAIGIFLISNSNLQNIQSDNSITINSTKEDFINNTPKKSDYWPDVSFIHVNGNWTETNTTYDWCTGSGTYDDPYVIQNVIVDAGGDDNGILINNSKNDYFIIKNCTVSNSGSLTYDAGIRLENTNNGTLINNTCIYNGGIGIAIIKSENNTIHENILKNNILYGAYINDSICKDNIFYNNSFINNGIHAYDDSNLNANFWNNTLIGNYWDNYTEKDVDDNNIGDTPYIYIEGSAGNVDRSPIFWDAPILSINFPSNYSILGKKPLEYSLTIEEGKGDSFWYKILETDDASNTTKLAGTHPEDIAGKINKSMWNKLGNGTWTIRFFVNDSKNWQESIDMKIHKDIIAPSIIVNLPLLGDVLWNEQPILNVAYYDSNNDSLWYRVYSSTIGWSNNITLANNTNQLFNESIWNQLSQEEFQIYIYANDTIGNINDTIVLTLYKDTINPDIIINLPKNLTYWNNRPTLNVSVFEINYDNFWYRVHQLGWWSSNIDLTNNTDQD